MSAFNPHDWQRSRGERPTDPNADALIRWGLTVAISLFLASLYPRELVPAVCSFFLLIAAFGVGLIAALHEEPIDSPHLTRWDEAVACMALSLLLKILFPVQPLAQAATAGP